MSIEELKNQFPLVSFTEVDHCVEHRNESATYTGGDPKPVRFEGKFIRMINPMGGADTVPARDEAAVKHLAEWHQNAAERRGFKTKGE